MDKIDKKSIDYDRIVEDTLRLVVKKSLLLVKEKAFQATIIFTFHLILLIKVLEFLLN